MIITRTPFRISFFGGGTDFPLWYNEHGGAVVSTTIDKYCYISCRKLPPFFHFKHKINFFSKHEDFDDIDQIQHPAVREVYRFMNVENGMTLQHDADLPSESGLGTSSAFTVGLLHALYASRGQIVTKKRLALEAIYVEQNMIQEAVGSQDQIASAFGGLNKIIFSSQNNIEVQPLAIPNTKLKELQDSLMLFFTGFSRYSFVIEEDKLKRLHEKSATLRAMHQMVDHAIDILNSDISGFDDFGKLLNEAWCMKKCLSNKVTTREIDDIYSAGISAGALGGKILGAGGGGFILFYVQPHNRLRLQNALSNLLHVPFRFDTLGSQLIYYTED